MLIEGICSNKRTDFLLNKCREIYENDTKDGIVLVIVLNSYKRACFIKELKTILPDYDEKKLKVLTFAGLCYNTFLDNSEYIAKLTKNPPNDYKANLCGLEVSQYIFKQCIKEADFSDYISKVNLLHQLFRRYSLIVQNCLTPKEIVNRARILNESFYKEAQKAIDEYKIKTIELKSFDYLRQMAILPSIYNNTDYFKNIRYLIIDDADEYSYAFWQFVNAIMPSIKDYSIAYDKYGSSRCGYLCAYKSAIDEFKKKYNPEIIQIKYIPPFSKTVQEFFNNMKEGKKTQLNNIKINSLLRRLEMINKMKDDVKHLINSSVNPSDIIIITPVIDDILKDTINSQADINYTLLSGSGKLSENTEIKFIISVLKTANNIELKDYELKNLLINLLKIPYKKVIEIIRNYGKNKELTEFEFNNEIYNTRYQKLISIINSLRASRESISGQIKIIYENLIKNEEFDGKNYEFLYKEAQSFETAFNDNSISTAQDFIIQTENSIISENPIDAVNIKKGCIIVTTPQKAIDLSLERKYQLWLDISSSEWLKEDTGTIYNSWVFGRDWKKSEYTLEDNINLTRDKSARIIRKLMLLAKGEITMYSSLYDSIGNENYSGLTEFIEVNSSNKKQNFNIIPRDDQKGVLDYKSGTLGIMAVPGAGKTTILLALIIKMIQKGIKGENIFVLTYMESAAKNFKEKIKNALPDCTNFPNISTIHGLALRIIKENGNFTKEGLDENFQICDDNLKEKIIKELLLKNKISDENFDCYLKCISTVKLSEFGGKITSKYKEINDFLNFYTQYNNILKQNNLIDYDDMLYYAVKILKNNPEILKYYQNICRYIIEDEAQDSTQIQQNLINLLAGKYKNIIRCGDINQSITSTFTNSDMIGFREFISNNKKIEMKSSQRCAKPIYDYANNFIKRVFQNNELKNAFYYIQMQGTDKNPQSEEKPLFNIFEREAEEKLYILNKIKEIHKKNPKASIGILLRLNSQVNEYNEYFQNNGIKTLVRSDCPERKKIFRIITSLLKAVENPLNNKNISDLAINILKTDKSEYINSLKEAFINKSPDDFEDEELAQLYWDMEYWLNQSTQNIDIIGLKAGLYYAKNEIEKENTYIISALIKRLSENYNTNEEIIKQLEYIGQKPLSSYKFFDEEGTHDEAEIQIMTTHKSKGDEFDYVFIPQLNEENYPTEKENVKLKGNSHFMQTIKSLAEKSELKTPEIIKQEQINETLRLIYVGITRAKLGLYMSSAKSYKKCKKAKINNFFTN